MSPFTQPQEADRNWFETLLGADRVWVGEQAEAYGRDETEDLFFAPALVLLPETVEETAAILKHCHERGIPVTPRGAGTGLSGGALPVAGGVVLAMQRLNRILHIDEQNLQATVEPGVINQVFQEAVAERGLFYPPDPASRGSCMLGGNIAHASGGPRAVKYGTTRDYVLNLEVVLPTGEIMWTGANTLKYSTGYNLTHLFIGSEGTLGVVTKIVFKLLPMPRHRLLLLAPFHSARKACEAVSALFRAGLTPSCCEFMERDAIDWVLNYVPNLGIQVEDRVQAHLLVEFDGNHPDVLQREAEQAFEVLEAFEAGEILLAESEAQQNSLWSMRRKVAEAVKAHSVYKEEDTVVPRAALPDLLEGVKAIGNQYGFQSVCYGHAGDGNLHVNIIKGNLSETVWKEELPKAIAEVFRLCHRLGGTISGEHGIGWVQKSYMPLVQPPHHLALQRGIKQLFDPKGILNPGKIWPE